MKRSIKDRLLTSNVKKKAGLILLFAVTFLLTSRAAVTDEQDWAWWNQLHNWEPGMPSWKRYIIISPGYLGPNALPVPEMKKGLIPLKSEISISASHHSHSGDPTQDLSAKIFLPFANGRIAIEVYGVFYEKYGYTETVRNERFSRNRTGIGTAEGDLYFSTMIQICRDRIFPNTLVRMAGRTASGSDFYAARFSDAPGYFFDISMSKDIFLGHNFMIKPFGVAGFYIWQTNSDQYLQNDAFLYGVGMDIKIHNFLLSGNFSGYNGYINNKDRPQLVTGSIRYDWSNFALSFEYLHGLRDWEYRTVRFTAAYKFRGIYSDNNTSK
ncbi:MAG: hypothetical protein FWG22_04115 [Prolixibacteraceae bacterium]|nr:hypothetical protein [Prolixibacteraceae bacterium]